MPIEPSLSQSQPEGLAPFSSSSPSLASKGIDPLASKVTAVLSTSYSDGGFRDALILLDDRGTVNDAKTRRHIRLDLQKEVIDCNGEIVKEFGSVAQQLTQIKATIEKINVGYEVMKDRVIAAHAQSLPTLAEASSLIEQKKQVETRQGILNAFKQHFIMSDDEITVLTSTIESVDDHFFNSLQKAKKVRQDCELLLGLEKQTLGLELMDQTSKNINFGFQKLYKWVQREFRTLNLENPQMNSSIRRALRVLAERPSLFQNCLDFFADARERILSEAFHCALTGTSLNGVEDPSIKPIDLAAHDPLRYVGDMLAWIHSATVSEREALEVLFVAEGEELARGLKSGRDAEVWRLVADEEDEVVNFNAMKALGELVDRDLSGAARVLRQRMEQVVQSNEDIITAYKVATLISFYRVTFEKLLGPHSGLLECVSNLESEAMRQFRALMRDQITALQGEFQQAPTNLEPPVFLQASFKQLNAIIRTYEASMSNSKTQEADIQVVLFEAFEPFISGCDKIAKSIGPPEDAIFRINYRLAAVGCLEEFQITRRRAMGIQDNISSDTAILVDNQYQSLRKKSGLYSLMESLRNGEMRKVTKESLGRAGQELDDFLPSALMDAMDRLKCLQNPELTREITEEAVEKFCSDFEHLELAIMELDQGIKADDEPNSRRSVFPRTTTELRVLLS
ncbi:Conserved oligomeric Golgi complex subunit 6 [Cladobotryum mycophilum]|uniref:Conserved oligomeric Golgi complex subunit 6 n=1 Tax=Cladobotryum mycophilum TaxID=491253 RepID=A0ABR0SUD8_9HYPO